MSTRHLLRWPLRTFLTTLGTSLSVTLLITAVFAFDSIDYMIDNIFFRTERQDASVSLVEVLPLDVQFVPTDVVGQFSIGPFSLGVDDADLVLTFRNLHNFVPEAREHINKAAFDSLKPGGLYGVVDHTRRHNEPGTLENWRRMDPVLAIREIQAVGFEFVDFSGLHYRPDDELRFEVGRKTVRGNSDRFTLLFRKPE